MIIDKLECRVVNFTNVISYFNLILTRKQRFPSPFIFFMSPFNAPNLFLTHLRHSLPLLHRPLVPFHYLLTHSVELERLFVVIQRLHIARYRLFTAF